MEVSGIYSWSGLPTATRENSPLLPKSVMGLIIGKSNCGKTTMLMNLLLQPEWLDYNHPLSLDMWVKLFKKIFKFTGTESITPLKKKLGLTFSHFGKYFV